MKDTILNELMPGLKENEGFDGMPYDDTEGFPTIGYGTKLPLSEEESTVIAHMRLSKKIDDLNLAQPIFGRLPFEAQVILAEMAYQMGVTGLLKFRNTWRLLSEHEFEKASVEMLDSKWYRQMHEADMRDGVDSINRAEKLAARMKNVEG